MTAVTTYELVPVGWVRSSLKRRADAPKQGSEGAPDARIRIEPRFQPALDRLAPGDELLVLTWLHLSPRGELSTHPVGDQASIGHIDLLDVVTGEARNVHVWDHHRRMVWVILGHQVSGVPM